MAITLLADSVRQAGPIAPAGIGVASIPHVVVTAVATASGRLRLISWRVSEDGRSIERLKDSGNQGDMADLVDICQAAFNFFVTASRLPNGKLRITAWKVTPQTGAIDRAGDDDDSEGAVSEIAMPESPTANGRVQIAVKDGAGNLVLKNWEVDQFGKLHRRGDTAMQGGGASKASNIAVRWGPGGLITAVRTAGGNLKLIVWEVRPDGSFKRLGEGSAGAVTVVSLAAVPGGVVTAVRDGNNNLKLIVWRISDGGMTVTRGPDSGDAAGGVDRIASVFYDLSGPTPEHELDEGDPVLLTAVRAKRQLVKLIKWRLRENAVDRLDEFGENTGPIDSIAHRIVKPVTDIRINLVAFRDGDGRLRLVTYNLDDDRQPTALPETLSLYNKNMFENTARVVTPALPACVFGAVVLNLGQSLEAGKSAAERRAAAGFVHRALLDSNGDFPASAPPTRVTYPFNSEQSGGTDNQIIRLDDGTLLALKNGYTWADLSPAPEWFDTVTMKDGMDPRGRNVIFILRSSDCGHNWTISAVIDSAVIADGKYGWPQYIEDEKTWWIGGFDRTELYQDPWTKTVWVSGHGDSNYELNGTSEVNHAAVIFRSDDRGKNWKLFEEHPEWGGAPYVLNSTPGWPLLVLMQVGTEPHLFALKKGASSIDSGHSVAATSGGTTVAIARDKEVKDVGSNAGSPLCMARVGETNQVRIAYPSVNADGRQGYEICNVTLAANGEHVVDRIATVEAVSPSKTSCTLGSFARDDLVAASDSYAMFTWIEAPPASSPDKNKLLARCKVFSGSVGQYRSQVLSLAAGAASPFSRAVIGHYTNAAGFHLHGQARFLAHWPVTNGIKGNIVSMPK